MVSHWSLSDNKSPQVTRTPLSILDDLNNAIDWIVSFRPLIIKSSCPFINPLVTVLRALTTINIPPLSRSIVFFLFSGKTLVLISLFAFFKFLPYGHPERQSPLSAGSLFSFCWLSQGLVVWPRLDDQFVSQNPREAYYHYYYLLLESFSYQQTLMIFHWCLSNNKYALVSRTLLSIIIVIIFIISNWKLYDCVQMIYTKNIYLKIIIIYSFESVSQERFYGSLSDSKSSRVSWTFLSLSSQLRL